MYPPIWSFIGRFLYLRLFAWLLLALISASLEYPIPEAYQREITEAEVEFWRVELQIVRKKFGSVFQVQPPDPLYPYDSTEQRINAFSGTTVVVPLDEGA